MVLSLCLCGTMAAQSDRERGKIPDVPPGYGVDASGFQLLTGSKYPEAGKIRDEERIYLEVRQKWYSNSRTPRLEDHGTTVLECAINRNGTPGKMRLAQSSGDPSLDAAAVEAVQGGAPFTHLNPEFKGTRVRLFFTYNLPSTPDRPACASLKLSPYKKVGGAVLAPRLAKTSDAEFSEAARKAKYQGTVVLGLTVSADGTPTEVCVDRGAGSGLDEKALAAANSYTFQPATENGQPVAVRISVEIEFRLY
jgi:TonB family protein